MIDTASYFSISLQFVYCIVFVLVSEIEALLSTFKSTTSAIEPRTAITEGNYRLPPSSGNLTQKPEGRDMTGKFIDDLNYST